MAENFANSFATTLVASIDDTQTALTVASSTGAPTPPFRAIIDSEIVLVTAVAHPTWTATRNVEGTTPSAHTAGAEVVHVMTAGSIAQFVADRYQPLITGDLTVPGDLTVVGSTSLGALTITGDFTVPGNLVVNGNTTLGNNVADTLTVHAGTWTIANNYTLTRDVGVYAPGAGTLQSWETTGSGDIAGNSAPTAWRMRVTYTGDNPSTGAFTNVVFITRHNATQTVAEMRSLAVTTNVINSGNLTLGSGLHITAPGFGSTGGITTLNGIRIANQGNALVGTAVGLKVDDFASATVAMRGVQSSLSSGTGKYNLYIDGTAPNYLEGNVTFGATDSRTVDGEVQRLQLEGTGGQESSFAIIRNSNNVGGPSLVFAKTRATVDGGVTVLQSADVLGSINFTGSDGTNVVRAAQIRADVDAAPGTNDMPGRIVFSTSSDGSATVTERWRITSAGHLLTGTDNSWDIGASGATRPRSLYWGTQALAPDGTAGAPSISFALDADVGFYRVSGNQIGVSTGAGLHQKFGTTFFTVGSDVTVGWHGDTALSTSVDLFILRDAANTLAQRNGTTAQTFRVYGTFTDSSNYERLKFNINASQAEIATEGAGTGVARSLLVRAGSGAHTDLGANGNSYWRISGTVPGSLLASTDNSYDIGANGATRPRAVYIASQLVVQGAGPHSIGGNTDTGRFLYVRGTFAGSIGLEVSTSLTQTVNSRTIIQRIGSGSTVTIDGVTLSGTNGPFALLLNAPTLAFLNLGAATTAATLRIETAPTGATTNYGAWITGDVRLDNQLLTADGTASLPAYAFTSATNVGFYRPGASLALSISGNPEFYWDNNEFRMAADVALEWSASSTDVVAGTPDLAILRDAAGVLAQRNGTNAQAFRLYNTFTDASNYERLEFLWSANVALIRQLSAGTGTARDMAIRTAGATALHLGTGDTNRWTLAASGGHLLASTDNATDIGASGATRPRSLFLGSNLIVAGAGTVGGALDTTATFTVTGDSTGTGRNRGFRVSATTVAPNAATNGSTAYLQGTLTKAGSGTHALFATLQVDAFTMGAGVATVTDAATLFINAAPTGATNNYAVWVDDGISRFDGAIYAADGTATSPSLTFSSATNRGFFISGSVVTRLSAALGGGERTSWTSTEFRLNSNFSLSWLPGTDHTVATDLIIIRDAANTLAQRNGTTAQVSRIYNTFTDASNYERLDILWTSNVMFIQTANGGTGTLRDLKLGGSSLYFRSNGSDRARFDTSGHLIWVVDNGLDIGASGANRPRTGYFGTSVSTPAVAFPATQVASADANTLDDYEEGTWTPALTFSTPGDLAVTYTTQAGRYQKIGNRVYCSMEVITSSFTHTTAAGTLRISGLPFAVGAVGNGYRGAGDFQGITKANFTQFTIQPNPSTSICTFGASGSAQALANVSVGDVPTGGSIILRFTFSYETA